MSLNRIWQASPNYSSRGGATVRLVVLHSSEGSTSGASLGNFFASPSSGVSSHVGIDDTGGTIWEYVRRDQKAWTAANANPVAVQAELCCPSGASANWKLADWNAHPTMLANTAAWIAEEAATFGIPVQRLTPSGAQGGAAGICMHRDLGSWGGGHVDLGDGFPMDQVIAQAVGGAAPDAKPPPGPAPAPPATAAGTPPWPGRYLSYPPLMSGPDVQTWQSQMEYRGWTITVDGMYGPQSVDVCSGFQTDKGLTCDGIVGPETWSAAWTAPIT